MASNGAPSPEAEGSNESIKKIVRENEHTLLSFRDLVLQFTTPKGIIFAQGAISLLVSHLFAASMVLSKITTVFESTRALSFLTESKMIKLLGVLKGSMLCGLTMLELEKKINRCPVKVVTIEQVLDLIKEITNVSTALSDLSPGENGPEKIPTYFGFLLHTLDIFCEISGDQHSTVGSQNLLLIMETILALAMPDEKELITSIHSFGERLSNLALRTPPGSTEKTSSSDPRLFEYNGKQDLSQYVDHITELFEGFDLDRRSAILIVCHAHSFSGAFDFPGETIKIRLRNERFRLCRNRAPGPFRLDSSYLRDRVARVKEIFGPIPTKFTVYRKLLIESLQENLLGDVIEELGDILSHQ